MEFKCRNGEFICRPICSCVLWVTSQMTRSPTYSSRPCHGFLLISLRTNNKCIYFFRLIFLSGRIFYNITSPKNVFLAVWAASCLLAPGVTRMCSNSSHIYIHNRYICTYIPTSFVPNSTFGWKRLRPSSKILSSEQTKP